MKFIVTLFIAFFALSQCKHTGKRNTYSNLPEDSARYMIWCDALQEDSNNADLLFKRAGYLEQKHLYIKALADINRATIIDTTKSDYFLLLGEICFAVNKTRIAALAYERAITLDKENYAAYLKLGELYYIVKEHAKSLENYDAAIKITPTCEPCFFYKGLNYREMETVENHIEIAIQMFEKAIALNPNYYEAYIQLGELQEKKNPRLALEYYNAALKLHPKSIEALYHRAYFYQMHDNFDGAGADYKRIIELNQNYADAYFNVAYMNMKQSKWKPAIEGFKLVVKLNSNNAGAWYNLGFCYEKSGDNAKARQAYNECLQIDKEFTHATDRLKNLK